jgi:hypothetical protein
MLTDPASNVAVPLTVVIRNRSIIAVVVLLPPPTIKAFPIPISNPECEQIYVEPLIKLIKTLAVKVVAALLLLIINPAVEVIVFVPDPEE